MDIHVHSIRTIRTVSIFLLLALTIGCVSTKQYRRLLGEHRELERSHTRSVEALSRENKVLHEHKLEVEKENSLLRNEIENLQAQLEAEQADLAAFRERMRQKTKSLEEQARHAEQRSTRQIREINRRHSQTVDSLITQLDTLAARLAGYKKECSGEIQALKNSAAKAKYDYEKELYALQRIKEELFSKLNDKERELEKLRLINSNQSANDNTGSAIQTQTTADK